MSDVLYTFHATIHARPAGRLPERNVALGETSVPALALRSDRLDLPLGVTFEETTGGLDRLERLFWEPDGSFFWRSAVGAEREWQLDGMLYDRDGRLLYMELKGRCPPEVLDRLLATLGWPATKLLFQLQREAVILEEEPFRGYAGRG